MPRMRCSPERCGLQGPSGRQRPRPPPERRRSRQCSRERPHPADCVGGGDGRRPVRYRRAEGEVKELLTRCFHLAVDALEADAEQGTPDPAWTKDTERLRETLRAAIVSL